MRRGARTISRDPDHSGGGIFLTRHACLAFTDLL